MEMDRFHIAQTTFFLDFFFSHLVGPSEQFGTHEKLSKKKKTKKKKTFSGTWIGLKIFLQVADIIIYSFCYI